MSEEPRVEFVIYTKIWKRSSPHEAEYDYSTTRFSEYKDAKKFFEDQKQKPHTDIIKFEEIITYTLERYRS